jgi:hypothetical protein
VTVTALTRPYGFGSRAFRFVLDIRWAWMQLAAIRILY